MQRILIAGVDTVLGSNLALEFARWFEVHGLCERFAVEIDGCHTEEQARSEDLLAQLDRIGPQWVIHCSGLSQSIWNETDAPRDDFENAQTLLAGSREMDYRLTVISSDAVFSGPRMFHAEDDLQLATGAVARSARQVECLLENTSAIVVRTHAYGWSPVPDFVPGIERLWDDLRFSAMCQLDATRHSTPILASDLASLLCRAMDRELTGLYHIAGAERINPYRFGVELASALGLPNNHVRCRNAQTSDCEFTVPIETSLDTRRACAALQTPMPLVREGLGRLAEQAEQGFSARMHAMRYTPTAA